MNIPAFVRLPNEKLGQPSTSPAYEFTDAQWQEMRESAKGKDYILLADLYFSTPECLAIDQTFWSLWGVVLDRVERTPTAPKSKHGRVCRGFTLEQLREWQRMLEQTPDDINIGSFRQQADYRKRVIRARKFIARLDTAVKQYQKRTPSSKPIRKVTPVQQPRVFLRDILPASSTRRSFTSKCNMMGIYLALDSSQPITRNRGWYVITPSDLERIREKYRSWYHHEREFDMCLDAIQAYFERHN